MTCFILFLFGELTVWWDLMGSTWSTKWARDAGAGVSHGLAWSVWPCLTSMTFSSFSDHERTWNSWDVNDVTRLSSRRQWSQKDVYGCVQYCAVTCSHMQWLCLLLDLLASACHSMSPPPPSSSWPSRRHMGPSYHYPSASRSWPPESTPQWQSDWRWLEQGGKAQRITAERRGRPGKGHVSSQRLRTTAEAGLLRRPSWQPREHPGYGTIVRDGSVVFADLASWNEAETTPKLRPGLKGLFRWAQAAGCCPALQDLLLHFPRPICHNIHNISLYHNIHIYIYYIYIYDYNWLYMYI